MGLYVIERDFVDGLDPDALDVDGIIAVNDDVSSADQRKTHCLYEAPNPRPSAKPPPSRPTRWSRSSRWSR